MKKIFILFAIFTFCSSILCQEYQQKRPERIEKLMKAVGNEDSWRTAKGFHMLEIANFSGLKLPLVRNFWIDFENPRIKIVTESAERIQKRALNIDSGWTHENGETKEWEVDIVNGYRSFWPGIPTRIFHLIASEDPILTYELAEDRINFFIEGKFVVWIATDAQGNPVAYGRSNNHAETHFLGEMINYGEVRLWKEAFETGGQWSVVMVNYRLLEDLSEISYVAPSK
ncbi:hypothetical protein D7Z94_13220 [Ulvibacterium marinum]|uniref:Uncharacterized protein n=2 Tax=Ulvibacterium marinum TaxID=2419782 RepID=A0A3B0C203_9FLAO|nr:hypothetical protein D7Z94_13220 [Ulvibacterium marinum]